MVFVFSGCLKTRNDLKNDNGDSNSAQATPTEVQANSKAVDDMRTEIQQLASRIDELQKQNENLNKDLTKKTAQIQEVDQLKLKISELESSQAALIEEVRKKEKDSQKITSEKESTNDKGAEKSGDGEDLFQTARSAYISKKYDTAIENFREYLKVLKAKWADEAHFLKGESHFQLKQFKKAIIEYSAVTEKFPKSKRAPYSLLKIGMSFEALGMKADAKSFYQEILEKYPKSPEAKRASVKLK